MATPTIAKFTDYAVVIWNLTTANPSGDLTQMPGFELESVHADGTFGGGTLTMQGTNYDDGTGSAVALKDQSNAAATLTAAGALEFRAAMNFIQPVLSGSTGASVTVTAYYRRAL